MSAEKIRELFKFSWAQAFSDQNGKSSLLSVAGGYVTLIGGLGFLYGAVIKDANLVTQSVIMTTIGTGVLMGRKIVNGKPEALPYGEKPETEKPNQVG
jgi:hypothetical protein